MKKVQLLIVSAMLSLTTSAFAATGSVAIQKVAIEDGMVEITVMNEYTEASPVTITAVKDGETDLGNRVYALIEDSIDANEQKSFTFEILDQDLLLGRGSGKYTIKVSDGTLGNTPEVYSFDYADGIDIEKFIKELKSIADEVTDSDKAYIKLETLMTDKNAGVFFVTGVDYEVYKSASPEVKNETLNVLYKNGVSDLTQETLPDAFKGAFGLATYNTGDHVGGVVALAPKYNGESINPTYTNEVLSEMKDSYDTIDEFRNDFLISYGYATINKARIGSIEDVLEDFKKATNMLNEKISKIIKLGSTYKMNAFEYIVTSVKATPVRDEKALSELLNNAYKNSGIGTNKNNGHSSSGSRGGGGGFGITGTEKTDEVQQIQDNTADYLFTDLTSDHWAAESVEWLKNKGIINGTDSGAFEPDRKVTREEFTKMIILACGIETQSKTSAFNDAEEGAWYVPYLSAAAEKEIVNGVSEDKFGVGQNITRQDMAVMVKRALAAIGMQLEKEKIYIAFGDEDKISDYAKEAVIALYEQGVINGKENNGFDPWGNATRAEAAKIIYEAFKGGI